MSSTRIRSILGGGLHGLVRAVRSLPFWALTMLVETTHFRLVARTHRIAVPSRRLQSLLRPMGSGRS